MDKKIIGVLIILAALFITAFFIWHQGSSGIEFKTVISGSMSPAINAGDVVVISKVNVSSLKAGDVITFGYTNIYTTHRIINVTSEGFQTKGDANEGPDIVIVRREEVEGKVIFTIPFLGYLGAFVKTPIGFAIFILIPGALIIISEFLKLKKELGKKKVPRLEYKSKAHEAKFHNHQYLHATRHENWVEKKIHSSKYETIQEEIERNETQEKEPLKDRE
jgi:signal peptidase